jgi:tetratricopeptide (TPR) repeat protein
MNKLLFLLTLILITLGLVIPHVIAIPNREMGPTIEDSKDVLDLYPTKEPTSADDYYNLGLAYLRKGMFQMSSDNFQKALELDPKHAYSLVGLMAISFQAGDMEAVIKYSNEATDAEPKSAEIQAAIGEVWMSNATSLEHLKNAQNKFREAIDLDPKFIPPRMNLARLYVLSGKTQESIKEYKYVTDTQPDNIMAHQGLSTAYLNAGMMDKASEEAKKVVQLSPQNPLSYKGLGEVYLHQGKLDEALAEFNRAVGLESNYAPAYKGIADVHFSKGLFDKAIEEYKRALTLAPNYGEAHVSLGHVYYLGKGMSQMAIEEYQKAISPDVVKTLPIPDLVSAYNNLAYLYAEEVKNLDKALSLAQKAKQIVPEHPSISDTLGWIYYKKGSYDEALSNLKFAAEKLPDDPNIRYHLGMVYYKQGDKDSAISELSKALEIDDKFPGAEDAKQALTDLGR